MKHNSSKPVVGAGMTNGREGAGGLTKFNWIEEASGVRLSTSLHLRSRWGCSQLPKNVHQLANLLGLLETSMVMSDLSVSQCISSTVRLLCLSVDMYLIWLSRTVTHNQSSEQIQRPIQIFYISPIRYSIKLIPNHKSP